MAMFIRNLEGAFAGMLALTFWLSASAEPLQLLSTRDPSQPVPAGGNGDSWGPVISSDSRYVLFASTADNLVVNSSNNPIPSLAVPKMNVFRRDRLNHMTELISVNLSGNGGGNGDSIPRMFSTNGQYVL